MNEILHCRRSIVSIFAILCLTTMGMYGMAHGLMDISGIAMSIAGICAALSGANSYQASQIGKRTFSTVSSSKPDNPDQP